MTQEKYFREELAFLKEQGREFTEIHPQLSRFLHGRTMDPDVERLLEGFAFLTAKLREKVEDEFPELTHSMINMLWPHYLRPIPSMSILSFSPAQGVSQKHVIPQGSSVHSKPVFDTRCQFQTCRDVALFPLHCEEVNVQHSRETTTIEVELRLTGDCSVGSALLDSLRFYIGGDKYSSQMLYLWLSHHLDTISINVGDKSFSLPVDALTMVGFDHHDALLPYPNNVYEGYRILQEYLAFPEAFHFFELSGLDKVLPKELTGNFTIQWHFSQSLPLDVRVTTAHFQLYCTPIINLFQHDADPINLSGRQAEYRLTPSSRLPSHYEVFNVEEVTGWQSHGQRVRGAGRKYVPFESFQHEVERARHRTALYYRARVKNSLRGDGFDTFLSLIRGDETTAIEVDEAVSVRILCTNRLLPLELGVGDIAYSTDLSPSFAEFKNITVPSQPLRPVLDGSLLWTLISNLSLNYLSLLSKDALSSVLKAYDFLALVDRQAERASRQRLDAIQKIETKPIDKIVKGLPIRGLQSTLFISQEGFSSEGDLFLFGTVLSRFFSLYASINSFHELQVVNTSNQERYQWRAQIGAQPLI